MYAYVFIFVYIYIYAYFVYVNHYICMCIYIYLQNCIYIYIVYICATTNTYIQNFVSAQEHLLKNFITSMVVSGSKTKHDLNTWVAAIVEQNSAVPAGCNGGLRSAHLIHSSIL